MIASIVMFMVLLSGLVATSSINSALRDQYFQKLANDAAESGSVFAYSCLKKYNLVPQWTTNTLKPNTDCTGAELFPCPITSTDARCGVTDEQGYRSTFEVSVATGNGSERKYDITGSVSLLKSGRVLASSRVNDQHQSLVFKNNPSLSRPAKRYWMFGNRVGFDFGNTGNSMSSFQVPCPGGGCTAIEGSTAISTKGGQLQFWTNGITIWNRNGTAMANGSGLGANGSTTQGAVVFPIGSDESKYVVISNNAENLYTNAGELFSTVIDMSLNGGLGDVDVTRKKIDLWPGTTDYSSEALTAAPKADGSGYWVLTFSPFTTRVLVFSFSNSGVVTGPPTSYTYSAVSQYPGYSGNSGFGSLNFNYNYSRLVMMAGNHCIGTCSYINGMIRVMGFNALTGVVTNQFAWNAYTTENNHGYSADFSPSGDYIYASTLYPARLVRYSLIGASSDAGVKATEQYVGSTQPTPGSDGGGQVLRAPDDKMYIANYTSSYVSVVNNPDAAALGSIGWVYNGISLPAGTSSRYGLPQTTTIYSPTLTRY